MGVGGGVGWVGPLQLSLAVAGYRVGHPPGKDPKAGWGLGLLKLQTDIPLGELGVWAGACVPGARGMVAASAPHQASGHRQMDRVTRNAAGPGRLHHVPAQRLSPPGGRSVTDLENNSKPQF